MDPQLFSDVKENRDTRDIDEDTKEGIHIKRILVPIDGSSYSLRAARYAIEVSKLQKAQIICIHVVEPLPYSVDIISLAADEYSQEIAKQAQKWFEEIIKFAKEKGIDDVKTEVIRDTGSIVNRIVKYATDTSIDLIVIGTEGKTGLKRLLLGSIANGITQHAHCPVLLIR